MSEWISAERELPKDTMNLLVWANDWPKIAHLNPNTKHFVHNGFAIDGVTHWQKIEPPKEEKA